MTMTDINHHSEKELHSDVAAVPTPLDFKGFQTRFQSYEISKWSRMPLELSPIECSKNGWTLVLEQTIRCDFCDRTINTMLPKKNYHLYQATVKSLKQKLLTAHRDGCVWKSGLNFPEYFATGELDTRIEDSLVTNSKQLSQHAKVFQDIKLLTADCLNSSLHDLRAYADNKQVDVNSVIVAAHGWQIRHIAQDKILQCAICSRRLSLWHADKKELDVTRHLGWCPWVYPISPASSTLVERMCLYMTGEVSRKRKRDSLDYSTAYQRKEELKEIVKSMRRSLS